MIGIRRDFNLVRSEEIQESLLVTALRVHDAEKGLNGTELGQHRGVGGLGLSPIGQSFQQRGASGVRQRQGQWRGDGRLGLGH